MPGYTGFIRGSQHIAGRTYGETTKRALTSEYREIVCRSPVPSDPQANRKIPHQPPADSFVTNNFAAKNYHVPGYTGFVPGVRHTYAKTYGAATEDEVAAHKTTENLSASQGFAVTAKPRSTVTLSSDPLPGITKTEGAPVKLIPSHLKTTSYLG